MHAQKDQPYLTQNDRWIQFILYPLLALAVVHIGNRNTFLQLIRIPSYYTDLLFAFACTFGLSFYFREIFGWLDRQFGWEYKFRDRLLRQIVWGILLPTVVTIFAEIIYLHAIHIHWSDSTILSLELPLVIIGCGIINLAYVILYYQSYAGRLRAERSIHPSQPLRSLVARQGLNQVQIALEDIAYFMVVDKITFIVTQDEKRLVYDIPLRGLPAALPEQQFFQLNRQVIASRNSILRFRQTETRRLAIELNPPTQTAVFIAKTKVTEFNDWIKSPQP
jgi:hypothetical protein